MIFISYYTKDTPYADVMKDCLLPSLKEWDLAYDIEAIEDRKSWGANTGYKPEHIKKMLLKHKQSVCFLDSDAIITRQPELLLNIAQDVDIAYHNFDWFLHWRKQPNKNNFHLLSGTMVFAYNDKVLKMIDEWIEKVNCNLRVWEQKILEEIIDNRTDLNIEFLPAEYCCVLMQDYSIPAYVNDPVIIHTQASRKYKHWWRDNR